MPWKRITPVPADGVAIAADELCRTLYPNPLNPALNDPTSPAWQEGGRVHNWQNYIGQRTRPLWASFSDDIKLALAGDADDAAGLEEWD